MDLYGLRTRDASGAVTLDTSVTPIRSLKMMTVVGDGSFDQYIPIPEIQAQSFVVVDTLKDQGQGLTWSPPAWWSAGQLQLRQPRNETWQVMILSQGGEPLASPAAYGIRTRNNNARTQIDPTNKVLSIRYSGKYTLGFQVPPDIEGDTYYSWPAPITTYERPLVFLNAADYLMVGDFRVIGSPGNWTGFVVAWSGHSSHGVPQPMAMRISWFCASYQAGSLPASEYGASVKDENSVRLFDSGMNIVSLNNQPTATSFVNTGNPIVEPGWYAPGFQMPWTGSYGDYFLANALLSASYIGATSQPYRKNFGGFLPGNRGVLQMYCVNADAVNPLTPNGRTTFAARPMKPI